MLKALKNKGVIFLCKMPKQRQEKKIDFQTFFCGRWHFAKDNKKKHMSSVVKEDYFLDRFLKNNTLCLLEMG